MSIVAKICKNENNFTNICLSNQDTIISAQCIELKIKPMKAHKNKSMIKNKKKVQVEV